MRTCELCGRPDQEGYLRLVRNGKDKVTGDLLWALKCRRCRVPRPALPAWDAMAAAEEAVMREPGNYQYLEVLRMARVNYELQIRPKPKVIA